MYGQMSIERGGWQGGLVRNDVLLVDVVELHAGLPIAHHPECLSSLPAKYATYTHRVYLTGRGALMHTHFPVRHGRCILCLHRVQEKKEGLVYPFNTVYLPLNYSANPGVNPPLQYCLFAPELQC